MKVMMTNAAAQSHTMQKGLGGEGQVMRVVGIGNAKSNDIMEEVKMEMLVVVMMIMGLVVIEMKVMLTNIEWAPRGEGQVRQVVVGGGALVSQRVIRSWRR